MGRSALRVTAGFSYGSTGLVFDHPRFRTNFRPSLDPGPSSRPNPGAKQKRRRPAQPPAQLFWGHVAPQREAP